MMEPFNVATYQIGSFCFELNYSPEINIPSHFQLFQIDTGNSEYSYKLSCEDILPSFPSDTAVCRNDFAVVRDDRGLEMRMLGVKGIPGYYACYRELSEKRAEVTLLRSRLSGLSIDPFFTSMLALERRMLARDNLILHCAFLRLGETAVLFSGPSGIGKSTQAELWRKYRMAEIINGDRALLRQIDKRWYVCGWPVCGSSEICHNESAPIHSIVMLEQGKENRVSKLSPMQAFIQLYGQITVNQWNNEAKAKAVSLLEAIVTEIPVFHLRCDMTEDAVKCLEAALYTCGK